MNLFFGPLYVKYRCQPDGDCLIWIGATAGNYGTITFKGIQWYVHRLMYEGTHGLLPKGINVLHTCDRPLCCNINHLFAGTQADNMKDKQQKGRAVQQKGEAHKNSILTNELVTSIYKQKGKISGKILAKQLKIGPTIIYYIWEKRRWTHVTDKLD